MKSRIAFLLTALALLLTGCGGSSSGIELVSAVDAADIIAEDSGAIILDVRTPEEFGEGHIEGAVNIDFYAADFAARLAGLDPEASYVVYCRSGNRSAETAKLMADLEFSRVDEIEGGILAWNAAGLPVAVPR
jgi:rhodanese-related sulfurtransferase